MKKFAASMFGILFVAALGFGSFKAYQTWKFCHDILNADTIHFEGSFENPGEEGENSLLSKGSFDGDLCGNKVHGYLYQEDMPTAMAEIYYSPDEKSVVNVGQAIKYGLSYAEESSGLPLAGLVEKLGLSVDCYVTASQLKEITGEDIIPHVNLDEIDKVKNPKTIAGLLLKGKMKMLKAEGEGDVNKLQFTYTDEEDGRSVTVDLSKGEAMEEMVFPESSVKDEYIVILQKLYELLAQK